MHSRVILFLYCYDDLENVEEQDPDEISLSIGREENNGYVGVLRSDISAVPLPFVLKPLQR